MDPLTQLAGSFFGMLLIAWLAVMLCTPIVWTWLALRAFRDLHRIADAISSADYERVDLPDGTRVHRRRGSVAAPGAVLSQFGR